MTAELAMRCKRHGLREILNKRGFGKSKVIKLLDTKKQFLAIEVGNCILSLVPNSEEWRSFIQKEGASILLGFRDKI